MIADSFYIGIALVLVGVVLMIMEFVHPGTFMIIPGTIVLFAGILLMAFGEFDVLQSVGGPFIVTAIVIFAGILAITFYTRMAPTHPPVASTFDTLKNFPGEVVSTVVPGTMKGKVRIRGEVWSARSDVEIPVGTSVRVLGGEGVTLKVAPMTENEADSAGVASSYSRES